MSRIASLVCCLGLFLPVISCGQEDSSNTGRPAEEPAPKKAKAEKPALKSQKSGKSTPANPTPATPTSAEPVIETPKAKDVNMQSVRVFIKDGEPKNKLLDVFVDQQLSNNMKPQLSLEPSYRGCLLSPETIPHSLQHSSPRDSHRFS